MATRQERKRQRLQKKAGAIQDAVKALLLAIDRGDEAGVYAAVAEMLLAQGRFRAVLAQVERSEYFRLVRCTSLGIPAPNQAPGAE
jgi:hypothetical protein